MTYPEKKYQRAVFESKRSNDLLLLIAACLILFVVLGFLKAIWHFKYQENKALAVTLFQQQVYSLFAFPAELSGFLQKPWTLISAMFVHDNNDFWNTLANMLWLWTFGSVLQDLTGNKKIIPVYIYGAWGGALFFVLGNLLFPSTANIATFGLGLAPCGVMAVAVVTTLLAPQYRFFPMLGGGIPLWWLGVFYFVISLGFLAISDYGKFRAMLGAGITGFLFFTFLKRGYDWSDWMNRLIEWFTYLFHPEKPARGKSIKQELFYKSNVKPYKKTPKITQERIDAILDKINQKGFEYLTDEEKEILKRAEDEL
ncbi:MAG: rhomboid family intramembrane serine protease [Chitinophagaceae bacterium]|nr:rhomboid family intramembrane serine protease [Chitinophagaceae bacterium]